MIMKKPQITTKLNRMMADEKREKLNAIACIIDSYKENNPNLDVCALFDELYELDLHQLNDILSDLISQKHFELVIFSNGKMM